MKRARQEASSHITAEGEETRRAVVSFTPEQELAVDHVDPVRLWADTVGTMFNNPAFDSMTESDAPVSLPKQTCIIQIESLKILLSRVRELRPLLVTLCMRDMEPWHFGQSKSYVRTFRNALNLLAWLEPTEKTERILWGALKELLHWAGNHGDEYHDATLLLVDFAQRFTIHEDKFDKVLLVKVFNGMKTPDQLYTIGEKNRRLHDALVARIIEKGSGNPAWTLCSSHLVGTS